jgi:hypothetical protein
MKQKDILKNYIYIYIYHVQYIMPYILIQVNEGITKSITLMVKGHLNKVMQFKCNANIIL